MYCVRLCSIAAPPLSDIGFDVSRFEPNDWNQGFVAEQAKVFHISTILGKFKTQIYFATYTF